MNFELPEELQALKQTLRNFVDKEMIPIERNTLEGGRLKPDIEKHLKEKAKPLGLWLFDVPEDLGGQGFGREAPQVALGGRQSGPGRRPLHRRAGLLGLLELIDERLGLVPGELAAGLTLGEPERAPGVTEILVAGAGQQGQQLLDLPLRRRWAGLLTECHGRSMPRERGPGSPGPRSVRLRPG